MQAASTGLGAPQEARERTKGHGDAFASGQAVAEGAIDTRIKRAALWLFVLLNIIFRDIHQFVLKSHLQMLLTAVMVQVPVGMVPFSVLLSRSYGRAVTFIAAALATARILANAPTDLDEVFHLAVKLAAMAGVFRLGWVWRATAPEAAAA